MNTCPKDSFDSKECLIAQNGDSFGCAKDEYCKYTEKDDSIHYNKFTCAKKKMVNEYCDKPEQCRSGLCSTYKHRDNYCYECIGD